MILFAFILLYFLLILVGCAEAWVATNRCKELAALLAAGDGTIATQDTSCCSCARMVELLRQAYFMAYPSPKWYTAMARRLQRTPGLPPAFSVPRYIGLCMDEVQVANMETAGYAFLLSAPVIITSLAKGRAFYAPASTALQWGCIVGNIVLNGVAHTCLGSSGDGAASAGMQAARVALNPPSLRSKHEIEECVRTNNAKHVVRRAVTLLLSMLARALAACVAFVNVYSVVAGGEWWTTLVALLLQALLPFGLCAVLEQSNIAAGVLNAEVLAEMLLEEEREGGEGGEGSPSGCEAVHVREGARGGGRARMHGHGAGGGATSTSTNGARGARAHVHAPASEGAPSASTSSARHTSTVHARHGHGARPAAAPGRGSAHAAMEIPTRAPGHGQA